MVSCGTTMTRSVRANQQWSAIIPVHYGPGRPQSDSETKGVVGCDSIERRWEALAVHPDAQHQLRQLFPMAGCSRAGPLRSHRRGRCRSGAVRDPQQPNHRPG
jgi:hypothetical protein